MSEFVDIIKDVSLVLAGAISGAVLAYLTSIGLEKRERNRRKRGTLTLLYGDIVSHLVGVMKIKHAIDAIAKAGKEEKEIKDMRFNELLGSADFYKRDVFLSLLQDLTLLPDDCLNAVIAYHAFAEKLSKELMRDLETKNFRFLEVVAARGDELFELGIVALSRLYAIFNEITVKEAEKAVRKALSTEEEAMKRARKELIGK